MRLQVGMVTINDFATTYMCQSLPFGGVKESGFGRFAGVEGLRALCTPVAVCRDRRAPQLTACSANLGLHRRGRLLC